MTWFKIDDTLWGHPKWIATSKAGRALWITAGSWSAAQLTDGHIPTHVLPLLSGLAKEANELVARGLWEATEGGWRFHDWADYQPTRADVESKRQYERDKKRQQRRRPDGTYDRRPTGSPHGTTSGTPVGSPTSPSRPVPSRVSPSPSSGTGTPSRETSSATADGTHDSPTDQHAHPDRFDEFWEHYPRKANRGAARAAWARVASDSDTTQDDIIAGLLANLDQLTAGDPRFIPHPTTWLNTQRWTDEPPPRPPDPWSAPDASTLAALPESVPRPSSTRSTP